FAATRLSMKHAYGWFQSTRKSIGHERLLLLNMFAEQSRRRRSRSGASRIAQAPAGRRQTLEHPRHHRLDERPCTHVARLLLAPDEVGVREPRQLIQQRA